MHDLPYKTGQETLAKWVSTASIPKQEKLLLYAYLEGLRHNQEYTIQLFAADKPTSEVAASGGRGSAFTPTPPARLRHIRSVEMRALELGVPMHAWTYSGLQQSTQYKYFFGVRQDTYIEHFEGTVLAESGADRSTELYDVHLYKNAGSGYAAPGTLVKLSIGFERFGADRGKMKIQTTVWSDPDTEKTNEDSWNLSDAVILSEEYVNAYDYKGDSTGGVKGAGLKIVCNLDIYGR